MSAGKYITLDDALIEQVGQISQIPPENHQQFLTATIYALKGGGISDETKELSATLGIKLDTFASLLHSAGAILWEFAKGSPTDPSIVSITLKQVGVSDELADQFALCYKDHKRELASLKGALEVYHPRFENLSWRLDMELARRSINVVTEPKFQLRLDLQTPPTGDSGDPQRQSLHLQADYANMKKLQTELQLAIDELGGTHCQRISRYIT